MKEKVLELVKEHTKNQHYEQNSVDSLSNKLNTSRNLVSKHLYENFMAGNLIKINERPVYYIDKKLIEEKYHMEITNTTFENLNQMQSFLSPQETKDFHKLIGYDGSLKEIVDKCKASISYPPNGLPIILHGPTGSGKSYIVKLMYEYAINNRIIDASAKFIHINCSDYANNPELLTANLFGYKKGAFTGADQDNIGLVKAAENGILFLDEVHCLRPDSQEKLFLFMDSGNYRMLGNNEDIFHSKVYLAFATTEQPEVVLLKTLYRRIPIRIEVPSIEERYKKEKEQLILSNLLKEQEKMQHKIAISRGAYEVLLTANYLGNIGELENTIQATCMNALFHQKDKQTIEIHTLDIPDYIIESSHLYDKSSYINFFANRRELLKIDEIEVSKIDHSNFLVNNIKQAYDSLESNTITINEFMHQLGNNIDEYHNYYLYNSKQNRSVKENYINSSIKEIIEDIITTHGISLKTSGINIIACLLQNSSKFDQFLNDITLYNISKIIKKEYGNEYSIAYEIYQAMTFLNIDNNNFVITIICFCLFFYSTNINNNNTTIGVIISHGYATASSIANAVNQLLNRYVFDSIDMPIDITTEMIIHKLNEYLDKRGSYQDIVLLVDMGSLEDIYKGIKEHSNVSTIAIANNVSTRLALSIGEGICQKKSLEDIFKDIQKNNVINYQIIKQKNKEKIILCSCATGLGTAEKLKVILENSLPESLPIKVLTYDYSTLRKNKLDSEFFNMYEVLCIVGTLNPNIEHVKFIPIEELIGKDSFDVLTDQFKGLLSKADKQQISKRILQNFSLTNIIENLTFLNPKKLLELVADAIDKLQNELNQEFTYNICFGLYVHICCLIERLVIKEDINEYNKKLAECSQKEIKFINHIRIAFKDVETYYNVTIPIEEISYIYIYITNLH